METPQFTLVSTKEDQGGSEPASKFSESNVCQDVDVDPENKLRHHELPNRTEVERDVIDFPDTTSPLSHGAILKQLLTVDEGSSQATDNPPAVFESHSSPADQEQGKASDPIPVAGEEAQPPGPVPASFPASPSPPSHPPSLPSPPANSSPPRLSSMPPMVDLSDLILHSPSSQIIGTPFDTNTTKFEYPFPDTSTQSPSGSGSGSSSYTHSGAASPMMRPLPPPLIAPGGGSFPTMGMTMTMRIPTATAASVGTSSSQLSSQLSFSMSPELPSYSPGHHKLRAQAANPPVPPSLQKKRPKWTLSLLGRRKNSGGFSGRISLGSPDSEVPADSIDALNGKLGGLATPIGSPGEERNA